MTGSYYAGQELDAPCGRCKGETRHRILSITDGVPEKLICIACNSVHKFRAERHPSVTAHRASRPVAAARAMAPRAAASPSRFQELMMEEQAGSRALAYSVSQRWEEGMWMDHPKFGLGRVQKRLGRKVDVLFRDGLKTLVSA
jgi:hypothetical protein